MKRKIIALLLTLAVLWAVKGIYIIIKPIEFGFDVVGNGFVDAKLFYTTKSGQSFDESRMIGEDTEVDTMEEVVFRLAESKIINIKIVVHPEDIKVKNLYYKARRTHHLDVKKGIIDSDESLIFQNLNISSRKKFDSKLFIIISVLSYLFFYKMVEYLASFKISDKHSRIDIVFVAAFFVVLFVPMMNIDDSDISVRENRRLARIEPVIKNGQFNLDFSKKFDAWFNDRFYPRDFVLQNYKLKKQQSTTAQENESAVLGLENWAFIKEGNSILNFQNADLFSEEEMKKISAYFSEIDAWCRKNGIKFYFFIAPDKNKIYGEYFSPHINKVRPDSESRTRQLIAYMKKHAPLVKVIYAYDELHAHKDEGLLYWKNDTHWNEHGGYIGYRLLMKEIQKDFPEIPVISLTFDQKYEFLQADLSAKLNINEDVYRGTFYKKANFKQSGTCIRTGGEGSKNIKCENPKGKKKLFGLRDSFFLAMEPYFAESFEEVALYWRSTIKRGDLERLKKFDIFVFESAERAMSGLRKNNVFPQEDKKESE